jgi:DNA-binding FadR family transcriptional regulator
MLTTIPRPKIRDIVIERLKNYIASEGLKAGDRLPNETELAARFGVSRLSLREATKALELLGIIESKTGVGLTVGRVDLQRVTSHLRFHSALQDGAAIELIDTRIVIETGALPYVARRMAADPCVYERLREQAERFRGTRDLQEWVELDIGFHRLLLESSGLAPLAAFHELLQVFFEEFRASVQRARWHDAIACHIRVIDALRDQDVERAIEQLRAQIESHKERLGIRRRSPRAQRR